MRNEYKKHYSEIFIYFFKMGCTGFGGPIVFITLLQAELIDKRNWISASEYQQALPLIKAMPGPLGFQTAVYLGRHRGGFWGGILAAFGTVVPSFILMLIFGYFTQFLTAQPLTNLFLQGTQSASLAIMTLSILYLMKPYLQNKKFWCYFSLSALTTYFFPQAEPLAILFFGFINTKIFIQQNKYALAFIPFTLTWNSSLWYTFWSCFKVSAFVFGTGLAALPILEHDFVANYNLISHQDFITAVTLGQLTPGPIMITVTYIGFKVSGIWGAILATLGVFMLPMINMLSWFPILLKKLKSHPSVFQFSEGAMMAAIGAISVGLWKLNTGIPFHINNYVVFIFILVYEKIISHFIKIKIPTYISILLGGLLLIIL